MIIHLMISEDVKHINELSIKNKRLLIIKKISNLVLKDVKIIKVGQLYKQGDHINKNTKLYFIL